MKTITVNGKTYGVYFTLETLPEDQPLEGHFSDVQGEEYRAENEKFERQLQRRLNNGDLWAFCVVRVTAHATLDGWDTGISKSDFLGGCSYKNEQEFRENDGYLPDMQENALDDLTDALTALN